LTEVKLALKDMSPWWTLTISFFFLTDSHSHLVTVVSLVAGIALAEVVVGIIHRVLLQARVRHVQLARQPTFRGLLGIGVMVSQLVVVDALLLAFHATWRHEFGEFRLLFNASSLLCDGRRRHKGLSREVKVGLDCVLGVHHRLHHHVVERLLRRHVLLHLVTGDVGLVESIIWVAVVSLFLRLLIRGLHLLPVI